MESSDINEEELVDATILKKLFLSRRIGGKHLPFRFVIQGLPNRLHNLAKKRANKLIAKGLMLSKVSTGEEHISLNPKRLSEVINIVERVFPELKERLRQQG
ncbi:hypothetical protein HYT26_00545 [Candidatus Pacearchaeota archaeon]|nr:hypothetical protein [Candidatus Pacearchaeota archaeon]